MLSNDEQQIFIAVWEGKKEMAYLMTHSPICYSFQLEARDILYAISHKQDSTHHSLCYTSCEALAGTKIAQWVHHEGLIQ